MNLRRLSAVTALAAVASLVFALYPRLPAVLASTLPSLAAAAGIDGTKYVEIAPTFTGSDGNVSFVRLSNDGSAVTTFNITVVGSPSGAQYGAAAIQVSPNSSPQYQLSSLLTAAKAGSLANGDTNYSLYLQDTDTTAFYQHVIYNGANGFFENMSTCKFASTGSYTSLNSRLDNVHTTQLSAYPAEIAVHNYASTAATYNASVYDAATGTLIGTVPVTVGANATNIEPFSWYQQQLNWTPTSSQLHANIVFQATGSATYAAEVSDYIYNSQFAAYVNMTERCPASVPAVQTTASCPSSSFLKPTASSYNTAYAAPTLSVTCGSTEMTVTSNGIPNFEFVQTTPNALAVVNSTYHIPITQTVATGTQTTAPLIGPEAVSVAGLPLFGPTESPSDGSEDPYKNGLLDFCGGHTAPGGEYHHHYRPDCLFTSATQTGLVMGYAFDGYPILAPYECTDTTCKTTYKVHSSYKYIGGSTASWSSNAYVAGYGNLDKCNGMTRPDGTYAYYATDEFPYFLACFHGVPDSSNFVPSATYATIITQ